VKPLRIAHFGSEMAPVVKVGGLGDVIGALSREQARRGHSVVVVLPAYRVADVKSLGAKQRIGRIELPWGVRREEAAFDLYTPSVDGAGAPVRVLLVDHVSDRRFFDRPGIYDDPVSGEGYPDNAERYLFYCRGALEGLKLLGESFDVLHAHDHQAGWVPCFARTHEPAIHDRRRGDGVHGHNLGYRGIHDPWVLSLAGFGRELFYPTSPFEFWGRVNYMKVGLAFADLISTVSPRYAKEIQTTGEFGFGLEGLLARRGGDLRGILNGIDDRVWDPARDPLISYPYDREHPEGKWKNRAALAQECAFPSSPDWPIVGMVSRLVDQKGFDLVEGIAAWLARLEARFVILGTGQSLSGAVRPNDGGPPRRVHYRTGFDEPFAHRIEAGPICS
jgi:starch synthase